MADTQKVDLVQLKTKDAKGKDKTRKFPHPIALKLLTNPIKRWELSDDKFSFNGNDLSKKK